MNENAFEPYPIFETERLVLGELNESDIELVFEFNSNLEAIEYVARDPWTDIEQAKERMNFFIDAYHKKEAIWWSIKLKSENKVIGYCGLFNIEKEHNKVEIGYGLLPGNYGKGLMTEAIKEIVDFAVNKLKLHRIYGIVVPGNTASEKILENFGFKREGVLKDYSYARKKYFDMGMFALINENSDW
ncbi:MAG: GNAT family protein [Ignavibacteria bacterium]|jgi:ribosomal-protein-alanine N-acetyltransferase